VPWRFSDASLRVRQHRLAARASDKPAQETTPLSSDTKRGRCYRAQGALDPLDTASNISSGGTSAPGSKNSMTKSPPVIAAIFSVKPFAVVPRITRELETALAIFQCTGSSAADGPRRRQRRSLHRSGLRAHEVTCGIPSAIFLPRPWTTEPAAEIWSTARARHSGRPAWRMPSTRRASAAVSLYGRRCARRRLEKCGLIRSASTASAFASSMRPTWAYTAAKKRRA